MGRCTLFVMWRPFCVASSTINKMFMNDLLSSLTKRRLYDTILLRWGRVFSSEKTHGFTPIKRKSEDYPNGEKQTSAIFWDKGPIVIEDEDTLSR